MERHKKKKLPTPLLPPEICGEILSKLPIKQILKLRCVSQLWRSLIDDPYFITRHLNNFTKKQEESRLLVLEPHKRSDTKQLCTIRRCKTFRKISHLAMDAHYDINLHYHYQVTGYVNGVLCVKRYVTETQLAKIFLWNPSIKRLFEIPLPRIAKAKGSYDIDCALGFDPITSDFKIVSSLHLKNDDYSIKAVEVYNFSTNHWRFIFMENMPELGFSEVSGFGIKSPCFWTKDAPKAYLDGVIYWIGFDFKRTPKGKYSHIVNFNVGNETFKYIDLPNCELVDEINHERFPVILRKSIALMDVFPDYTNIWVMKNSFWAKQYTINLQLFHKTLYLKSDGILLFAKKEKEVSSYNLENQEEKVLATSYNISPLFTSVYKESLLLANGFNDEVIFDIRA